MLTFISLTHAPSTPLSVLVARATASLIASSKLVSDVALNSVTRATLIRICASLRPSLPDSVASLICRPRAETPNMKAGARKPRPLYCPKAAHWAHHLPRGFRFSFALPRSNSQSPCPPPSYPLISSRRNITATSPVWRWARSRGPKSARARQDQGEEGLGRWTGGKAKGRSCRAPALAPLVRESGRGGGGMPQPDYELLNLTFRPLNVVNVRCSVFKSTSDPSTDVL